MSKVLYFLHRKKFFIGISILTFRSDILYVCLWHLVMAYLFMTLRYGFLSFCSLHWVMATNVSYVFVLLFWHLIIAFYTATNVRYVFVLLFWHLIIAFYTYISMTLIRKSLSVPVSDIKLEVICVFFSGLFLNIWYYLISSFSS